MVGSSARRKFVLINLDDILLAAIIVVAAYYLVPDLFVEALILVVIGLIVIIAAKYYLLYPMMDDRPQVSYDIVGRTGVVIETVTETDGRIRVGGEIWHARCQEGVIDIGQNVMVTGRENLLLWVSPIEGETGPNETTN